MSNPITVDLLSTASILNQARALCYSIEGLPASKRATDLSLMAANLLDRLKALNVPRLDAYLAFNLDKDPVETTSTETLRSFRDDAEDLFEALTDPGHEATSVTSKELAKQLTACLTYHVRLSDLVDQAKALALKYNPKPEKLAIPSSEAWLRKAAAIEDQAESVSVGGLVENVESVKVRPAPADLKDEAFACPKCGSIRVISISTSEMRCRSCGWRKY